MVKLYKILFLFLCLATINISFANDDLTGVEPKIKFVQCYPNPATSIINIDLSVVEKGYVVTIYNFIGKKVDEIKLSNSRNVISVDNYYRGIYVYQLRNKQGQLLESGKFQVAK